MKTTAMTETLYQYVIKHVHEPHPILDEVRRETSKLVEANMQIPRDQGAFMHWLVKLIDAKNIVELGTFTGYSSIAMATALPADGHLVTIDRSEESNRIAKGFFERAGLSKKIDARLGDGRAILNSLLAEKLEGKFDLAFIDADKPSMPDYYELVLKLLRPGGVVLADNVIWGGKVVNENDQSQDTVAIRAFNEKLRTDDRVEGFMLHIADGIYCVRKK